MARDYTDQTNINAPDGNNPYGIPKDENPVGARNGTLVNEKFIADAWIFFQKLLDRAGITANNVVENDVNGYQFHEALDNHIFSNNNISFERQGNVLSLSSDEPAITALSTFEVAYINTNPLLETRLRTYTFDGTNWSQVGNSLIMSESNSAIAALDANTVALYGNTSKNLRTYTFDGTNWSQVGNVLNLNVISKSICFIDTNRIAFIDSSGDDLSVYEFNGTNWSQIGNSLPLSIGQSAVTAIAVNRIVVADATANTLTTYTFNGTDFVQEFSNVIDNISRPSMSALNSRRIVLVDETLSAVVVYEISGTSWQRIGSKIEFDGVIAPSVTALSKTEIAIVSFGLGITKYRQSFDVGLPPSPQFH